LVVKMFFFPTFFHAFCVNFYVYAEF